MRSLLLVDGDRNFRCAMEIALRLEGVEVTCSASVRDALPVLAARRFDLVVVDSLLIESDRLLAHLGELGQPAVATGPHRELLDRAVRRHRVATLEKPFSADQLLAPGGADGGVAA